jgi:pimeloyl-ACP methyl ester carboxylesterase
LSGHPARELVVIVHGCFASAGEYESMAEAFRAQGKQAYCFNYDDREHIAHSAVQLAQVVEQLVRRAGVRRITVVGHSQGGLVARRALVRENGVSLAGAEIRLVTVSAPFGGIRAASQCASLAHSVLSLGLNKLVCLAISGNKWSEIPPGVAFVEQPGTLQQAVVDHLKIVAGERGRCRVRDQDERCLDGGDIFSVDEQRQAVVDDDRRMREYLVKAGHVEIVGSGKYVPKLLIDILRQQRNEPLSAREIGSHGSIN